MNDWVLGVAGTVVGAIVLWAIVWFFTPFRNRLERRRMTTTGDHGLSVLVSTSPSELNSIRPENRLNLEAHWLAGDTFYFARRDPPDEDPPRDVRDWWNWARRHGGEDVGFTHALVRIQAAQDRAVVVERPRIIIGSRSTATSGVICSPEGLGGNGLLCRRFYVKLDDDRPEVRYIDASDGPRETAQFVMRKGDTEAFLVIAQATVDRHEWSMEIPCVVDGEPIVLQVTNGEHPFVTVGAAGVPRYMRDGGRWVSVDQVG